MYASLTRQNFQTTWPESVRTLQPTVPPSARLTPGPRRHQAPPLLFCVTSITCVSPACDVTIGGRLLWPLSPGWQTGWQDVAAEPGTLPVRPLQSDQGDVVVAAVRSVRAVKDDLLNSDFLLKLLGHQSVVIPNPHSVAPRAVPVPGRHRAVRLVSVLKADSATSLSSKSLGPLNPCTSLHFSAPGLSVLT